jgi:hypothetical protein
VKYDTVCCQGYWSHDPDKTLYEVTIARDGWDEVEDADDERIFYYMEGEPLDVGTVLEDGFVITKIYDDEEDE